ncbi:MAG: MFS transporter [Chloroflexi bacterium]|nr:MFS transporter [Chloroflexota bacterium]
MAGSARRDEQAATGFYYGWVIVAVGCTLTTVLAGVMYTYGVFFKPLIADFDWSRAAVSGIYSVYMLVQGFAAIGMGWLADRTGPRKIMLVNAVAGSVGLLLTSQIGELWQIYLTFGLFTSIGLSGTFAVSIGTTARWFSRNRGLALGIVAAGTGLGTLIMPPLAQALIDAFGWPTTYIIFAAGIWLVLTVSAFLLKLPSPEQSRRYNAAITSTQIRRPGAGIEMRQAFRSRLLWLLFLVFAGMNFCVQIVLVHLVNYATDIGIATLVAVSFVSIIGIGSITGRLVMGASADRIGTNNALIFCCLLLFFALTWLTFARGLWMFYVFAIFFGFAYGGEVPQMAALVDKFFGLRAVAALVGVVQSGTHAGGSLGAWAAGKIFDVSNSYAIALMISALVGLAAFVLAVLLRRWSRADRLEAEWKSS